MVTAVLFVYAFNQYGTLALPGIPAGENFGLSGESRFIEFFYFVFFLLTLAGGFCCCLLTAFFYRRDKSGNPPIIGYAGGITFLNTLVFYLVCVYLYYPQIAQTGFIALYTPGLYLPLFLSVFLFLRHSRFLSFYLVLLLAVPFMIILCTE